MQLTFLQLVQRAYRESGIGGSTGPASVLNQSGRNGDFVKWVLDGYEEIQNLRGNWNFLWRRSTFDLAADDDEYSPTADFGLTGVAEWVREGACIYREADGLASRQQLGFMEWALFRDLPLTPATGFPTVFCQQPDGQIRYYPMPGEALKVIHEYWLTPQTLSADADVPILPARFHMAIVWKAVMNYAQFNKDWSLFDSAQDKYQDLMDGLYAAEQQPWTTGGPLA